MRTAAIVLLLAAAASADTLEDNLAEKLKKPFASNAAWVRSYAEAKKIAAEKDKVIFGYFSRSYAP